MISDEPKRPFISKQLERAVDEAFSSEIASRFSAKREVMLDPNNTLEFQHGRRWEAPANEFGERSGEVSKHSFEMTIHHQQIVDGNPASIFERAEHVASQMHSSFERMMFEEINRTTEKTGNIVNSADHATLAEAIAEMLETVEMNVDKQGNLQLPTIVVSPKQGDKLLKQLKDAGPDFEKRIEEIKERKRAQALERERLRQERFERPSE